ncbi:hypothetical protein BGW39_003368 [Mortierella sp. 14UC]|nr:hypothetical protein BGW39_003368 [Mortierella sp. 14UC]
MVKDVAVSATLSKRYAGAQFISAILEEMVGKTSLYELNNVNMHADTEDTDVFWAKTYLDCAEKDVDVGREGISRIHPC